MDMESPSRFTGVSTFVDVLYYLSRNGRLDQPHLLQIPFSPLQSGLRLKDVKKKLALIRGDGFPSTFAWSYKRGYKKGYVWQDLCDDDTIVATQSHEYVLKGSEIIKGASAGAECRHVCGYTKENASKHHLQSRADVSTQTEEVHHQSTVMEQQQDSSSVDIAVNSPTSLDNNFGHDVVVSSVAVTTEKDRIGTVHAPSFVLLSQEPNVPKTGLSTSWHNNHVLDHIDVHDPSVHPGKPSISKHFGVLSFLQFISCGGMAIKDDILSMSTYNLSSTCSTPLSMHMPSSMLGSPFWKLSEALGPNAGQVKLLRSLHDKKLTNHEIEATNIWTSVKSKSEYFNRRLGSTLWHLSNGLQDIVSIGRMSVSDRRTNGSRELGSWHLKMHQELNEPSKNKSASQAIQSESHRRRPLSAELYSRCMVAGAPATNVSCFPDYNQDSHVAELWHELSRYAQNMK